MFNRLTMKNCHVTQLIKKYFRLFKLSHCLVASLITFQCHYHNLNFEEASKKIFWLIILQLLIKNEQLLNSHSMFIGDFYIFW